MESKDTNRENWFAAKVFNNRISEIEDFISKGGYESYVATHVKAFKLPDGRVKHRKVPLINSLLFFKTSVENAKKLERELFGRMRIYRKASSVADLAVIPDDQMRVFKLATATEADGLEYLGADTATYSVGQQVLVTGGPFEGTVGRIFRIKGDKRLVVTIDGVCAVATSYIPACFLQKI